MFLKTILGFIITIFLTTSPLLYSDSTNNNIDTATPITESQLVENEDQNATSNFSILNFITDCIFSLLIIWLMWLTWKNAKKSSIVQERLVDVQELNVNVQTQMVDIHRKNVEIQKQIANIQDTNVKIQKDIANIQEISIKVAVIPEMLKIINILDDIVNIQLDKYEDQLEKNRINFNKLGQLTFYLNESDGLEKSIIELNTKVWDLTGKMSEMYSIALRGRIEPNENEQRNKLYKEMTGMLKEIHEFIFELKKSIIKRFRLDIELKKE